MKMTRRLAITIAVVCGVLAALLTYFYLSGLQKQQAPSPKVQVQIVTPVQTIEAGTIIKSEMLKAQQISEDEAPPGAVHDISQIEGDIPKENLPAGQPIKLSQMASQRGGVDLSYVVPEGMRAVTVALDPITGVAGFLQPGDRVDVVATFDVAKTVVARTVLQNVELLALGETTIVSKKETEEKEGEKKPEAKAQPNATLAVTPEDAQKLIVSDAKGTIRLALRRKGDGEYRPLKPTDIISVVGAEYLEKEVAEERPPQVAGEQQPMPSLMARPGLIEGGPTLVPIEAKQPSRPTVEVIRGSEREIVAP